MADDGIVQTIILAGDPEVIEAFNRIGEAGTRAFEGLEAAVEKGVNTIGGVGLALAGVTAALATVTVGAFAFVQQMAELAERTENLSSATGASIEVITGLQSAFASSGVGAGQLAQSFRRLSVTIQQSWSEIKKASSESALQSQQDILSIEQAQLGLANSQRSLSQLTVDQNNQSQNSTFALIGAEQHLREVQLQRARSAGVDTSSQDQSLARARSRFQLEEATLAVSEAATRKEREAADQAAAAEAARLKVRTDNLNLQQLERKQQEDQKNDINNIINAVQDLAAGNKDALSGINASAENLAKGIIGAAGASQHALGGLKGDIANLASGAPDIEGTFLKVGEVLGKIEDPALRSATAIRLLGRNVSEAELRILSDPVKIGEFIQRIKDLGLALSPDDLDNLLKYRAGLFGLQNDIGLVAQKIGAALAPAFATGLRAIDDVLIQNKAGIQSFAQEISGSVLGAIESLIRVLSGKPLPGDEWTAEVVSGLKSFGGALKEIYNVVKTVATYIIDSFKLVAQQINETFGTNLSGAEIAVGAWAAGIALSITGGLLPIVGLVAGIATRIALAFGTALVGGATAVSEAVTAVVAGLGPLLPALAITAAGIYAFIKAYSAFKDLFTDQEKGDSIKQGVSDRLHAINEMLSAFGFEDFKKGLDDWTKANQDQATRDKAIDDGRASDKRALLRTEAADHAVTSEEIIAQAKKEADATVAQIQRQVDKHKELTKTTDEARKSSSAATATQPATANPLPPGAAFRLPNGDIRMKDGSIIDKNGIRIFGASDGGGSDEGGIIDPGALASTTSTASQKLKVPLRSLRAGINPDGSVAFGDENSGGSISFGGKTPIQGFDGSFPVTKLTPDEKLNKSGDISLPQPRPADLGAPPASLDSIIDEFLKKMQDAVPLPRPRPDNLEPPTHGDGAPAEDTISQLPTAFDQLASAADTLSEAMQTAADAISGAASRVSTPSPDQQTVAAAGGGHIQGPGGPKGDQIPAMLSHNEFVHQSEATDFWGLGMMRAINDRDLGGVMQRVGQRFRDGGLVIVPQMPRHFAGGGYVAAMTSGGPTGHIAVDLRTDHGPVTMYASPAASAQLQRLAATKRITATSKRKPEFVG